MLGIVLHPMPVCNPIEREYCQMDFVLYQVKRITSNFEHTVSKRLLVEAVVSPSMSNKDTAVKTSGRVSYQSVVLMTYG